MPKSVFASLLALVTLVIWGGTPISQADELPPLVRLRAELCATSSDGRQLNETPFRGQIIRLWTNIGGTFGDKGRLFRHDIYPPVEEAPSVTYTVYYTDGSVTVPGQAAGWEYSYSKRGWDWDYHYTYLTVVADLAQPYVEARAAPKSSPINPYKISLSMRKYLRGWQCSSETNVQASLVANAYVAEFVSQSAPATMTMGSEAEVEIKLRNAGTVTWERGPAAGGLVLATDRPQDRTSSFYAPGKWLSPSRPAVPAPGQAISPGKEAWFYFTLQAPTSPGNYKEYFRPVVEGFTWFNDLGIHFSVQVELPPLPNKVYLPLVIKSAGGW